MTKPTKKKEKQNQVDQQVVAIYRLDKNHRLIVIKQYMIDKYQPCSVILTLFMPIFFLTRTILHIRQRRIKKKNDRCDRMQSAEYFQHHRR